MIDREKVIKDNAVRGLQSAIEISDSLVHLRKEHAKAILELLKEHETMMQCIKGKCRICPHCTNCDVDENGLLKEQEAVEPEWFDGTPFCGNCGHRLEKKSRNSEIKCPTCERAVKWLKTPTAGDNKIPLKW